MTQFTLTSSPPPGTITSAASIAVPPLSPCLLSSRPFSISLLSLLSLIISCCFFFSFCFFFDFFVFFLLSSSSSSFFVFFLLLLLLCFVLLLLFLPLLSSQASAWQHLGHYSADVSSWCCLLLVSRPGIASASWTP